jgi:hypothetical protein
MGRLSLSSLNGGLRVPHDGCRVLVVGGTSGLEVDYYADIETSMPQRRPVTRGQRKATHGFMYMMRGPDSWRPTLEDNG